jgi:hypothetical protein
MYVSVSMWVMALVSSFKIVIHKQRCETFSSKYKPRYCEKSKNLSPSSLATDTTISTVFIHIPYIRLLEAQSY